MSRLIIAILLAQSSLSAAAATYTVSLHEFGFNRQDCAGDIAQTAVRFGLASGTTILGSGCLPPAVGQIHPAGTFTYVASEIIATTTSDVRDSAQTFEGHYRSIEECEAARHSELREFQAQTGLAPYVSYCYQANSISLPRYRVRIDAVGTSTVQKHSESATWSRRPIDAQRILQNVMNMAEQHSGRVVAAAIARDISGYQVVVDYYATESKHLHAQEQLHWQSASECEESARLIAQNWSSDGAPSVFDCVWSSARGFQLLQVYQSENILSGFDFSSEILPTDYPSRTACSADSERIKSALEAAGTIVLGKICGQDQALRSWQLGIWTIDP